jgi:zinc-binding in reverse transcriptase
VTHIWKAKVTPSCKIFFYLLLNNKLLTQDIMRKRNFDFKPRCVLCQNCPAENVMHLFFLCPFATNVWVSVTTHLGINYAYIGDSVLETYINTYFITTLTLIWKERNNHTFNGIAVPTQILF